MTTVYFLRILRIEGSLIDVFTNEKIITEKDIRRHVSLVEQLLNHTKITVNELAEIIGTTERTIFSDLQSIRSQLPEGWDIISDQAGISLQNQQNLLTNDLWEIFFQTISQCRTAEKSAFTKKLLSLIF